MGLVLCMYGLKLSAYHFLSDCNIGEYYTHLLFSVHAPFELSIHTDIADEAS